MVQAKVLTVALFPVLVLQRPGAIVSVKRG
jgi:hypothetical protein